MAKLKGFKNPNKTINQTVTLDQIDQLPKDADVNIKTLLEAGIIDDPNRPVKILNVGKLTSKRKIQISKISTTAKNAIIKSGSEIIE